MSGGLNVKYKKDGTLDGRCQYARYLKENGMNYNSYPINSSSYYPETFTSYYAKPEEKTNEEYINGRRVLFRQDGYIDQRCQFARDCESSGLDPDVEYARYKANPSGYKVDPDASTANYAKPEEETNEEYINGRSVKEEEDENEVPFSGVLRKIPASLFNFDLFFDKLGKLLEKSDAAFVLFQHRVEAKSVTKGSNNSLIVHNQQTNQYYRISKGDDNSEFVAVKELTNKEYEDDKKIVLDEDKIYVTNYTGKRRLAICEFDFGLKPTFEINMRLNGNICLNCETAGILKIQKVDLSGLKLHCVFDSFGFMTHDCAMFIALSRYLPGSEFVSFSDMDRHYN